MNTIKNVLAFDTSGEILSIYLETEKSSRGLVLDEGLRHAERLLPEISEMLNRSGITPSELHLVAVSAGPGSFTGLRIGMAAAKGLSAGSGAAIVSVPTLDALAYGKEPGSRPVMALLDARKGRFYCGFYSLGERLGDYLDCTAEEAVEAAEKVCEEHGAGLLLTGPGAELLVSRAAISESWSIDPLSRAGCGFSLAACGKKLYTEKGADSRTAGPLYLRKSEAELSAGK